MLKSKPRAAVIIAEMKKERGGEVEPTVADAPEAEPSDEGLVVAAEEALSAISAGDAAGFAAAMKSFWEQC